MNQVWNIVKCINGGENVKGLYLVLYLIGPDRFQPSKDFVSFTGMKFACVKVINNHFYMGLSGASNLMFRIVCCYFHGCTFQDTVGMGSHVLTSMSVRSTMADVLQLLWYNVWILQGLERVALVQQVCICYSV